MARHYLEFEQPIAELEGKIDELSKLSADAGADAFTGELSSLRDKVQQLRQQAYGHLDSWQKTLVARHPERPHLVDYIGALIEDFVELRGDRKFADDQAIMGGLGRFRGQGVVVLGHEKGHDTATRLKHNFGMARPEGYRKAVRLMAMARQFNLPLITFVDTAGAYPGVGGEERGQAEAIARSTEAALGLPVPVVATITGEGGSGGALALAAANRVLILEHSVYSVITPEGCASILWRDNGRVRDAAEAMKMTAQDLIKHGIVDQIIPEPLGGAHADPEAAIEAVGSAITEALAELTPLDGDTLIRQREARFYAIGRAQ